MTRIMKAGYSPDKKAMMDAAKARREFYSQFDEEVEVTDIILNLNLNNSACSKAVGRKSFSASEFVRYADKNTFVFKREQDEEEVAIKRSWIKNLQRVEYFIQNNF